MKIKFSNYIFLIIITCSIIFIPVATKALNNLPYRESNLIPDPPVKFVANPRVSGTILYIEISGTPDNWAYYDIANIGTFTKIVMECSYCWLTDTSHKFGTGNTYNVIGSSSHSVQYGSSYATQRNHVIIEYIWMKDGVQENNPPSNSKQWGSCLKTWINTSYIVARYNKIENCYGEAIGFTESSYIDAYGNYLSEFWHIGIYPDNARYVTLTENVAYCTNSAFFDGTKAGSPWTVADEKYSGYYGGSPVSLLSDIVITDNISFGCTPTAYWGGVHEINGVINLYYVNNYFYMTKYKSVWYAYGERNSNIVVSPNYFSTGTIITVTPTQSTVYPTVTSATFTPSKTATPTNTPTSTKTSTPTSTKTLTPTRTPSRTPTNTPVFTNTATKTVSPTNTYTPIPTSITCPITYSYNVGEIYVQITISELSTLRLRNDHYTTSSTIGALYSDSGIEWNILEIWKDCSGNYWGSLGEGMWIALKVNNVYYTNWRE